MSPAASYQPSRTRRPFGSRLADAMDDHGPLCVGIDPHPNLLDAWGLADSAAGLRDFALRTIDAVGGHVAAVKPQSAFFERHGSAGIAVLEETLAALRDVGTLSVLDVKRGDIGSTMAGYAQAYLSDGAPLAADSITVSPYLGYGSLTPALNLAEASGRGVFVLALTSNPEGAGVQHAVNGDQAVAAGIVEGVEGPSLTWESTCSAPTVRCWRPGSVPREQGPPSWKPFSGRRAVRSWPPPHAGFSRRAPPLRHCEKPRRRLPTRLQQPFAEPHGAVVRPGFGVCGSTK